MKFIFNLSFIWYLFHGIQFNESQASKPTIAVFYLEQKGAYSIPYTEIIETYQKKSLITNQKKIAKILNALSIIKLTQPITTKGEFCNYVIRINYENKNEIIGFDNGGNHLVYLNHKGYSDSSKLIALIKRNCIGRWNRVKQTY